MTRESRAKWLAFATAAMVVLVAALFSLLRNLPASPSQVIPTPETAPGAVPTASMSTPASGEQPEPGATQDEAPMKGAAAAGAATTFPGAVPAVRPAAAGEPDPARVAAGERAYSRLGCASCHSIAGRGPPSSPLDGVGGRLDRSALREFSTGTGAAREVLGAGLAQRKARALADPDLEALLDYLAQLR